MTGKQRDHYRDVLRDLLPRVERTAAGLEEAARSGVGGEAGGNLSNTPMHLADLGSEAYSQELSATLLENEAFLRDEVRAALGRIDEATFGRCQACNHAIPAERLNVLPYTRYCVPCAEKAQDGPEMNLNAGRPAGWADPDHGSGSKTDSHAAGTAGGGTAVGGLGGTNIGGGAPDGADLEGAMGSGRFDVETESEDEATEGYAGHAGGAVGGTPAGKRVSGGRRDRS